VATPFTRTSLRAANLLPLRCVVEELELLLATVERCLQGHEPTVHPAKEG